MSEELAIDDQSQSHYEISLTAGQAFVAFVLLLLSLAASFAFGLMIGKGQADERLVVRKEPAVINEASVIPKKKDDGGRIVELGVSGDDFTKTDSTSTATTSALPVTISEGTVTPTPAPAAAGTQAATPAPAPAAVATPPAAAPVAVTAAVQTGPAYAQLLSTGDQKIAESLAARLIDRGYTAAYVERLTNEKGPIFRVRVKFAGEADARAAEPKLREFSKDVWITH
jgi:hypothetical protein